MLLAAASYRSREAESDGIFAMSNANVQLRWLTGMGAPHEVGLSLWDARDASDASLH